MFFEVRFLTSVKNYLNNGVTIWNRCHNSQSYNNCICFITGSLWEDFRSNLQQKKASDEKYNILKDGIFVHLSTTIVTQSDSKPEEIPSLIFDLFGVRKAEPNHFEESKKHFKKIKILKRFEELEKDVITFNENLNTEDKKITEIVSNYLKDKGFKISTDASKPLAEENIVSINNLIPALKLFWYRKEFDYIQGQNDDKKEKKVSELKIKGHLIILVSDKEKEIIECIECLKRNQIINEKYDSIRAESDRIIEEANKLASIIKRILVDEYKK